MNICKIESQQTFYDVKFSFQRSAFIRRSYKRLLTLQILLCPLLSIYMILGFNLIVRIAKTLVSLHCTNISIRNISSKKFQRVLLYILPLLFLTDEKLNCNIL